MAIPGVNGLIFCILGVICILPVFMHLIVSDKNAGIRFTRIDTATSILSIFCFLIYSIQYGILSIYSIIYNQTLEFSAAACIVHWWTPFWMSFGNLFTTLFFISRLYKTFHGSAFAISKKRFKISITAFTFINIITSMCISSQVIRPMFAIIFTPKMGIIESIHSYEDCSLLLDAFWSKRKIVMFTAIAVVAITDIITSVVLLRVYLKKVVLLSIACNEINSVSRLQSKRIDKKNRHTLKQNALFLSLAEKTSMIVILLTISYFAGLIVNGSRIGQHWMILDHITRSFCVYMTYKCAKKMYNIICFKGELCFECWKHCCFCCCKINELPSGIQLRMNSRSQQSVSIGTTESKVNTDTKTKQKVVIVPRLRLMSIDTEINEGAFVDDTECDFSYPQTPSQLTPSGIASRPDFVDVVSSSDDGGLQYIDTNQSMVKLQ